MKAGRAGRRPWPWRVLWSPPWAIWLSYAGLPGIAAAFVAGDASTKAALAVVWRSSPDLLGFWGYGAIGIWVLVVSILALRGKDLSSILNIIGILLALLYILVPYLGDAKKRNLAGGYRRRWAHCSPRSGTSGSVWR